MSAPTSHLQRRLMTAFAAFTVVVAAVFGLYAMAFTYAVEDRFFDAMLEHEASVQLQHWRTRGDWATPREAHVRLYRDAAQFPADLRRLHVEEPQRREFAGDHGRHYHVRAVIPPAPAPSAWLVAEVSGQLVVRPMRDELLRLLGGTLLVLVAAALLAGYALARRTARPLARLAEVVDAMAPDHLPPPFAADFADDEVGTLARGLDGLVARIRAFIAREQEFTRDASHELRTPLAVIRGAAERLLAEPQLSAAGRAHVAHLRQSAMQLEHTVTLLLSLAREEAPALPAAPVALLPLVERVVVEQAPLLDGKPVDVAVEVPAQARLHAPAAVVHVLLSNLVGNAFAHTDAGSVRIGTADGRLQVVNAGRVAAADGDWAHGAAYAKREGSSGFGLGLAIVRRLCERYGIDLRIEAQPGRAVASIALAEPRDGGQGPG